MNEAFVDLKTTHLLRSVLNEVLNGFTVEDLDGKLAEQQCAMDSIADRQREPNL